LISPIILSQIPKVNYIIITNLRVCFAEDSFEPLRQVQRNQVYYIPLKYVEMTIAPNTLMKQLNGLNHKIRVSLTKLDKKTRFEEFYRLSRKDKAVEDIKLEFKSIYFNFYLLTNQEPTKLIVNFSNAKDQYTSLMDEFTKNISINIDKMDSEELLSIYTIKELVQVRVQNKFEFDPEQGEDLDEVKSELLLEETVQEYMTKQEEQKITNLNLLNPESSEYKEGNQLKKDNF
jgi:hypothetical protein